MRQVIRTRYLAPTNTRGARIRASCEASAIIVHWNYEFNIEDNHADACSALQAKLGWTSDRVGGCYRDAYYWVEVQS